MALRNDRRNWSGAAAAVLCTASLLVTPVFAAGTSSAAGSFAELPSAAGLSAADKLNLVLLDENMFTGAQYKPGINFADGTYYYETVLQDDTGMTVLTNQSMSLSENRLKAVLGDRFGEELEPEDMIPAFIASTYDYDENTVIDCEEGTKFTDKFGYPVYICSWTQGNAGDARQFVGMAVDAGDYMLLYTVDANAETYSTDPAFYNSMLDRLSVYDYTSEVLAIQSQAASSSSASSAAESTATGNTAAQNNAAENNAALSTASETSAAVTVQETSAGNANAADMSAANVPANEASAAETGVLPSDEGLPFDPEAEGDADAYVGTWQYDGSHILVTINEDATWTMEDPDGNVLAEGTADLYAEGAVLNDDDGDRVMVISGDTDAISTDKNGTSSLTHLFRQSDYYDYWSNPSNGTDVQLYADGTWEIYEQGEVVNSGTAYMDDAGYHILDAAGDELNCYVMDTINTLQNSYGYTLYRAGNPTYSSDDEVLNHYDYTLPYAYTDNEGNVWYWNGSEDQYIGTTENYFVEGGMYFENQDFGDDDSEIYDDVNSYDEEGSAEDNVGDDADVYDADAAN